MPLITFTGLPCSGKTTWAKKLQAQLQEKIDQLKQQNLPGLNYSIIYHSDETLGISHDTYKESNLEKHSRGNQMSVVKRDLSRSNIVILDSLSYIKGFRYQLFCEAKGVVTPHCVIHVVSSLEKSIEWNQKDQSWDDELIKQLAMRYEEPNQDLKWDSPLFTIISDDPSETLPLDEIWDALVLKRPPPPNAATLVKATSGNDFLQELDKQTLVIINRIIQHQQIISQGGDVLIDQEKKLAISMPLEPVSTAQLQRIRRTYISLNRMRTIDIDRITPMFVEYLNSALNQ